MPITTSAKKALRQNQRRRAKNIRKKREMKKLIKELRSLISRKKIDEAKKLLPRVYKILDKAAKTGLIKKNTADRKKSRLAKAIKRAE